MMEVSDYEGFPEGETYVFKIHGHIPSLSKPWIDEDSDGWRYAREIQSEPIEPENEWVGKFWETERGGNFYCTSVRANGDLMGFGFTSYGNWFDHRDEDCETHSAMFADSLTELTKTDRIHPPTDNKEVVQVLEDALEKLKSKGA